MPTIAILKNPRAALLTGALAALAILAGCGGGGGAADAASGSTTATTPTAPTSTATPSSYALGAISGFGSVVVGGIRYDDSKAEVLDSSGKVTALSALKLGTVVALDAGTVDRRNGTAVASRFRICEELLGPVASVNATASTLVVLGQTVVVNSSTVFDSALGGGLSALAAGAVVEVHGSPDSTTGQITATRIEAKTGATAYHLRGPVAALDATAKTFKIGAALISYGTLAATDVPATLANGGVFRVVLATAQSAGAWVATALRSDVRMPTATGDVHIEGAITVFTSATSFEIAGQKVDASAAAFPDGSAGIVLGARVEVTGALTNGVLVATQVELDDKPSAGGARPLELHGVISSLNTTAKTFVVRTVTVSYSDTTTYSGGTVATLADGKNVDVYGVLSSDRTQLSATKVSFR